MHYLPEKLRHLRKKRGWSQEELARNLGVSLNTVQRWEMGRNKPSRLAIEKLQTFLKEITQTDQLKLFEESLVEKH
jgi:transcriptional regulator with XRE-family HTH domain